MLLDRASTLLSSYSLQIVNEAFLRSESEVVVFKTLTSEHENIEDNS